MSKRTFGNQFFVVLAFVFVPMFALFRYFESIEVMQSIGIWNTFLTALVLSIVPAVLICLALRYLQK